MSFLGALVRAKHSIDNRVRTALGQMPPEFPSTIRQEVIGEIESRIALDSGGRYLPFRKIVVQLNPRNSDQRDAVEKALLHGDGLRADIVHMLNDLGVKCPEGFEAVVAFKDDRVPNPPETSPRPLYEIDFIGPEPSQRKGVPETRIAVTKGTAEQARYRAHKERILVGRLSDVSDREGRIVRRNDIVFLENDSEINSSVEHAHARIWFDHDRGEFRILDEGSHYGTRIVRNGIAIEVPGVDSHGMSLQTGDDIYLGQACLHFELG